MRKAPAVLAVLVAALFPCVLPSNLEGQPTHQKNKAAHKQSPVHRRHKASKVLRGSAAVGRQSASSRHSHPVIFQDALGQVVPDRFPTPPAYGPFYPGSLHNHPEPLCEPVDVVVEVRLHEPEGSADGEGEPTETAQGELRVEPPLQEPATLSAMARKLRSLFHPKSSAAVVTPQDVDLGELLSAGFQIPVEGMNAEKLRDSFLSFRGRHRQHLAIDIGAPRGTPVLATTEGEIVRITRERRGGKSIYQKDSSGQYLLFYCHLSRYAKGLAAGQNVKKGEVIGYIGSTGHVVGGSHLHFSITKLPQDDLSFKRGLAINPYLLFLAGVP